MVRRPLFFTLSLVCFFFCASCVVRKLLSLSSTVVVLLYRTLFPGIFYSIITLMRSTRPYFLYATSVLQYDFSPMFQIFLLFILLQSVAVSIGIQSSEKYPIDCTQYFTNGNFEWMWMSTGPDGELESGTAEFYANMSMVTWDPNGVVVNKGTYEITRSLNSSWCYALEVYTYPEPLTVCKTFSIDPTSDSLVGCLNTDSCFSSCGTSGEWQTWSAARLRYRFES
jgi:hypothetical protein